MLEVRVHVEGTGTVVLLAGTPSEPLDDEGVRENASRIMAVHQEHNGGPERHFDG